MNVRIVLISLVVICINANAEQLLDPKLHHLRSGEVREWDDFPENAESGRLVVNFDSKANATEYSLRLRHRDLKQQWKIHLNGREIAKLPIDENPMSSVWAIPPRTLKDGANTLAITCAATPKTPSDDIEAGEIVLIDRPRSEVLSEASVTVEVTDLDGGKPLPCRLTVVDERGFLVPLGNDSDATTAARIGVLYTINGKATLQLPAGRYAITAGRGFEWNIASAEVDLKSGESAKRLLCLRREVDTAGLVAADTHVHTFEYSRHGDSTLHERLITLAGEGVELSVATDHNLTIDYTTAGNYSDCRQHFTPIIGNEVTTPKLGHFNIFPIPKGSPLIDFRAPTWEKLFANIQTLAPGAVIILNHARDIHGGFRPFDPSRHLATAGEDLDGWKLQANAMEVLNSSAIVTDPLLLYRDWMGCINGGLMLTPIGASDVHDVARYIVGQGRTYVRCDDQRPGEIDLKSAVEAFRAGRVLVSYGLLTELRANGRSSGETVKADGPVDVEITVMGPAWAGVSSVQLFRNGEVFRTFDVAPEQSKKPGLKWSTRLTLDDLRHDVFLSAVATGPGITAMHWPCAKPYQPTTSRFTPYVLGATGAVFIDADGSGAFDSALTYATKIVDSTAGDIPGCMKRLESFDASVAVQTARLLRARGTVKTPAELKLLCSGTSHAAIRAGFARYADQWQEHLDKASAAKSGN